VIEEPLPVVTPYALTAAGGAGPGTEGPAAVGLRSNAPDAAVAEALRTGFAALAGRAAAADAVTLAQGMPAPGWATGATEVFAAARGLEDWRIEISDMTAKVSGLAPSVAAGTTIRTALEAWAVKHGFALKLDLANGPRVLDPQAVQEVLDGMANCGPLFQVEPPVDGYPLGSTITIEGAALVPDFDVTIGAALAGVIGDRKVVTSLDLLNQNLCTVRSVLPPLPSNALSVWLGHGDTGEANLVGVFTTGQNPVVDVLIPANVTKGRLWVMVVDTTNTVYNLLPNANFAETDIAKLGTVEGGTRRVRVLFSVAENKADNRLPKAEVTPSDYGKSEIIAFLTEGDLFDTRRPADESIGSFSEALAGTLAKRPGNVIGFASRILETRP
jgi:eukaryotic-like serine/threonine-protein kinase